MEIDLRFALIQIWPRGYKSFFMLSLDKKLNVKMPTIVSAGYNCWHFNIYQQNANNCLHFYIYQQDTRFDDLNFGIYEQFKFYAQLS